MRISSKKLKKLIKEAINAARFSMEGEFSQQDREEIENIVQRILPELETLQNESLNRVYLRETTELAPRDNFSKVAGLDVKGDICFDMDGVLVDFAGGVMNIAGSIENLTYLADPSPEQIEDLTVMGTEVSTQQGAFGETGNRLATLLVDLAGKVKHMLSRGRYKPAGFIANNVMEVYEMMYVLGQSPTFRQRFWQTLPVNSEGMLLFSSCRNRLPNRVGILTSPLLNRFLDTVEGKKRWIGSNLALSPPDFVIMDGNKQRYAISKDGFPNLLIDDWEFNLSGFKQAGGITALFRNGILEIV